MSVVLAGVVMVTLAGCTESSDKNPYGGLNVNDTYATSGSYSLTVGDLYNELRHNSLGYLTQRIEEATFDDYLDKVSIEDADQKQLVAEYILKDIHGTYDEDELDELSTYTRNLSVSKYVDAMFMEGYKIDGNDFNSILTDDIIATSSFTTLWTEYSIDVAKYLYAFDVLTEEIEEQDADAEDDDELEKYFSDSKIATYFDNNYGNEGEIDAVIIRFINQNEADAVLKRFGIKTYNGEWYLIQPPVSDTGQTDFSKWEHESDYNEYYDEYVISQSNPTYADTPISVLGSETTILKIFAEIYNYIYTYRTPLTYESRSTIHNNISEEESHFLYYYNLVLDLITYDRNNTTDVSYDALITSLTTSNTSFDKERLDNYSTSLTTYIHGTLSTKGEEDEDGNEEDFTQYTASSRSYNGNYYLMYKMSDAPEIDFYDEDEDDDGNTIYTFNKELTFNDEIIYDTILNELFNNELSDAYISNKASARSENIKVEIYDSTLDFYYSQSVTSYTGTKGTENNIIARIIFDDGELDWELEITVLATYEFLEPIYGPQTAVAKLFEQYILESDYYDDVVNQEDAYQVYKDNVYNTLTYFANDYYSSYGYPASIGKYNFMKNFYRTAVVDEAIEYLMLQDAKREFFLDIDDSFYTEMLGFTNAAYDNYYSLTVSNILVYVDMDEDGTPDADWFTTDDEGYLSSSSEYVLSATAKQTLAKNLIEDIITYAYNSTDGLVTTFSNVVEEYNNSTRIEPSSDAALSGSIEALWAKYRKHGLYISTNDLGEFSNTTVDQDAEIKAIVENLYEDSEIIMNNSFTGATLIEGTSNYINNEQGVNLLLVTSGNGTTDIDFENEDEEIYTNVPIKIGDEYKIYESLVSTSEKANEVQVEVYCREYFTNGSSTSLSSSATAYLDTYLNPVLTKFNSEVVQLMIIFSTLDTITSTENTSFNESVEDYILYLQRISDDYVDTTSFDSTSNFKGFWAFIETIGGAN